MTPEQLARSHAQQKAWRDANAERIAERRRAYKAANRERVAANRHALYIARRDRTTTPCVAVVGQGPRRGEKCGNVAKEDGWCGPVCRLHRQPPAVRTDKQSREYARAYRLANRDRIRELARGRPRKRQPYNRAYRLAYYAAHADELRAGSRAYYRANRERYRRAKYSVGGEVMVLAALPSDLRVTVELLVELRRQARSKETSP